MRQADGGAASKTESAVFEHDGAPKGRGSGSNRYAARFFDTLGSGGGARVARSITRYFTESPLIDLIINNAMIRAMKWAAQIVGCNRASSVEIAPSS